MSLQGQLRDFGVADVFQLIAQQRKTGMLEVEQGGKVYEVYFDQGAVVRARPREKQSHAAFAEFLVRTGAVSEPALADALRLQEETFEPLPNLLIQAEAVSSDDLERIGKLITDEIIFELFLLEDGRFEFTPRTVDAEPGDEAVGAEQVLLDALRMQDEWEQVRVRIPDFERVPTPGVDIEEFRNRRAEAQSASGVSAEGLERLFTLSDGRQSARRVIDLSQLGTFRGGRGLAGLCAVGMLRLEVPQPREGREEPRSPARKSRSWLTPTALGVAVLSIVLLFTAPVGLSDPRIPADGLEAARRAVMAERIRLDLEVRRWVDGAYPEALAAPSAARYLYQRSERGYALYPGLP
jgi:hypothetical protein